MVLGDFAVLLATGLSPVRVLLCNLFCACCAFIGLYIGIAVSSSVETRQWIFAATAGMFLYVALVNMVNNKLYIKIIYLTSDLDQVINHINLFAIQTRPACSYQIEF